MTPAKLTVLAVTESFLSAAVNGDVNSLDRLILWGQYGSDLSDVSKSRRAVLNQVQAIAVLKQSKAVTPFSNFRVGDIDIDEDYAEVELVRGNEDINIELLWTGTSWMIADDDIFGEAEYIGRFLGESS